MMICILNYCVDSSLRWWNSHVQKYSFQWPLFLYWNPRRKAISLVQKLLMQPELGYLLCMQHSWFSRHPSIRRTAEKRWLRSRLRPLVCMPSPSTMHGPYSTLGTCMSIKKEACWTTSSITAGNKDQIRSIIEADLFLPLVYLLQNAGFKIKKMMLGSFRRLLLVGPMNK